MKNPQTCIHTQFTCRYWIACLCRLFRSVSVIIFILIMLMDWHIADPICSFCISIMIFVSVIPLFQECIASLSQRIPEPLQPVVDGILQHV